MRKTNIAIASACAALMASSAFPAAADEPAWGYPRAMACDGETVLAHVTPGGVFTTFHVDGSTDVIIAKHLEILGRFVEGEWTVTRQVPGFTMKDKDTVHCEYVDQWDYPVRFVGLRR